MDIFQGIKGGVISRLQAEILQHLEVASAVAKARAAGVPWALIIATIIPFILAFLAGSPLDIGDIVQAILDLLKPKP